MRQPADVSPGAFPSQSAFNVVGLPSPPLQDEDNEVLKGGIEALRGHVLDFPKEAARGAMDRNMDDVDNLVVRSNPGCVYDC